MAGRNGNAGKGSGKRTGNRVASKLSRSKDQRKARRITIRKHSRHVRNRRSRVAA